MVMEVKSYFPVKISICLTVQNMGIAMIKIPVFIQQPLMSCADNLDSDCDGFDDSPLCHQHALDFETSISSVSTAPMGTAKYVGDINNDGIADVALGAMVNDNEQHTGIFFGPFDGNYTTDQADILIDMTRRQVLPLLQQLLVLERRYQQ